jgi:hypothetical protein
MKKKIPVFFKIRIGSYEYIIKRTAKWDNKRKALLVSIPRCIKGRQMEWPVALMGSHSPYMDGVFLAIKYRETPKTLFLRFSLYSVLMEADIFSDKVQMIHCEIYATEKRKYGTKKL